VNRDWPGFFGYASKFTTNIDAAGTAITTRDYVIRIPQDAKSLKDVRVETRGGELLFAFDGNLENSKWLPGPADPLIVWSFADSPRLIPPPWGLTPAPPSSSFPATSAWDLGNDAPDVYVFLPLGTYPLFRRDFLKLTGPTGMPPLFAFGAFDSRWYDYSETTALQQVEEYRKRRLPLDVLVVDTGWRQNASTGYQPNTNLFPDLGRFFDEAHAKHVRVMFNDHPEPVSKQSLDPVELEYRFNGLKGLLDEGLDVWWYDRNWMVSLVPPATNLHKEVWGMRMYHDMTQRVKPERRPIIMANVDGIDNGVRNRPPDVAAHRFPVQWTGDIGPSMDFLRHGVENCVDAGVQSLFPYMSEDLGGHTSNPTPEAYIRWIEYGALSPLYRPHCTHNLERMPWTFGPEAERIARRYVDTRYRLLPLFYAAAHENYETGAPLLRRLDLDYPQFSEAGRNDEYQLGDGILVAPIVQGDLMVVPASWLTTPDGRPGLQVQFFNNETVNYPPIFSRIDKNIDFDWGSGSPDPRVNVDHFSARWAGSITVPENVGRVVLATLEDDGARVWVDGRKVIDAWGPHDSAITEATGSLSPGKHFLRVEYLELEYSARIGLKWRPAAKTTTSRAVWIPPGNWINAWNGQTAAGPAIVTNQVSLDQIPLYVRSGTILPLAPEMQFTGERPWDPITLDIYPRNGETNHTILYEDDTVTTAYQRGEFRTTRAMVSANTASHTVRVEIDPAKGTFAGALETRTWVLRLRRPMDWPGNFIPDTITVNGVRIKSAVRRLVQNGSLMPFGDAAGAPDTDVFELTLPSESVSAAQNVEIRFAPGRDR
jgi:hypothetical protein